MITQSVKNKNTPQDGELKKSIRNSLSKLTQRVTLKAPEPAQAKPQPKVQSEPKQIVNVRPAASPRRMAPEVQKPAVTKESVGKTILKEKPKQQPIKAVTESRAAAVATSTSVSSATAGNVIGKDITIEGSIKFEKDLVIGGQVKGEVSSKDGHLVIEENAKLDTTVKVGSLIVEGEITGDITADKKVRLASTAVVNGDITTGSLAMDPGCQFNGRAHIGTTSSAPEPSSKE